MKKLNAIVYYVRKVVGVFGWVSLGAFFGVGMECGWTNALYLGMALAVAVGVLANVDNEKVGEE